MTSAVPSADPSSTTMISLSEAGKSCSSTLTIACSMKRSWLYVSIKTLTNGLAICYRAAAGQTLAATRKFYNPWTRGCPLFKSTISLESGVAVFMRKTPSALTKRRSWNIVAGLFCCRLPVLRALRNNNFFQDRIQAARDFPIRVMALEFPQVRDVADVVALARLFYVAPVQLSPRHPFDSVDSFEQRDAVLAASTQVVYLAGAGICREFLDRADYVVAMNVVANLFALIPEDAVAPAAYRDFHQIGQKTVQLHARMRWSREAAAAKNPDLHLEITAILLSHDICRCFGCPEE